MRRPPSAHAVPARQQASWPRRRQAGGWTLPLLLLGVKLGWPLAALLVVYAIGGDDPDSAARAVRAARDAEQELMRHIATAEPAIEQRLRQWLTARDGVLLVRGDAFEPYSLHAVPASAAWRASCGVLGLSVTVAGFRKDIGEIALDERQCSELLSVVGRTLRSLTDRPALQPGKGTP